MRKTSLFLLSLSLLAACAIEQSSPDETSSDVMGLAAPLPKLRVSANGRFLEKDNGSPFFYLSDTAWELFHRLSRTEAVTYLQNRADNEFTVVQAVAVAELDGVNTPNAHGDKPFTNNNPATPATTAGSDPSDATQYDYWDHVDFIVDEAQARGIYTAFLPTWGSHVLSGVINASNAQSYGQFLGSRYASKAVIWVLGGDRSPAGYESVWRALAKGIAIGVSGSEDYSKVLMTYHPPGGATSSTWFHNEAWLDFNMQQNGHCTNTDVWSRIGSGYALSPTKPVMDGEPLYEQHPICFNAGANGYSNDYEVRKFAYWDVFAGGHGHTYGHHSVWQMYAPGRGAVNGPVNYWYEAINQPGAAQMKYLRRLIEARPFLNRVPDQTVLASSAGSGTNRVQATRGSDGSYAFVYSASGQSFSVNMNKIAGTVRASWYDPRNGTSAEIGSFPNTGIQQFNPPSSGAGGDWVLVLDSTAKNFPLPGDAAPPPPPPPPPGSFYRAINLNGAATTIDGNSWEGSGAPNFTFTGSTFANQAVALNPATDQNRATMIRSSVWGTAPSVKLLSVPNGAYTVYLYTWEDNDPETFSVFLEGALVQSNYNSGAGGTWKRLGPWTTTVNDGSLDLAASGGAANLSGIEVYAGSGSGFVTGVNFNGSAVTIDGNAWKSYSTALTSGLTVNAPKLTTTAVTPSPAVSSAVNSMLNSAVWTMGTDLNVGQSIPNGNYQVYLWVMENYQSNSRSFKVRLEGSVVASSVGSMPLGAWSKLGPYSVTVTDGVLNLDLVRVTGDPHLMGMAIFN